MDEHKAVSEPGGASETGGVLAGFLADSPVEADALDHGAVPAAIARFIAERSDRGRTLTIGITAPPGTGKTFFAKLVEEELLAQPATDGCSGERRSWYVVWFDAYAYERGAPPWAALANAIYDQPWREMGRAKRIRFRTSFEWSRRWKPFLVRAVGSAAVGTASGMLAALAPGGSGLAAPVTGIAGGVLGLLAIGARQGLEAAPFKEAIESYAVRSGDTGHAGLSIEAEADLTRLIAALTEDGHGLAVFIQNLGDCSGNRIIELLESVYRLRTTGCVFVIEMDRDAVALKIEMAQAETIEFLRARGHPSGEAYGLRFLANVLDLSIAVPPPTDEDVTRLVAGLLGSGTDPKGGRRGGTTTPVEEAARLVRMTPEQQLRFYRALDLQLDVARASGDGKHLDSNETFVLAKWVAIRVRWPPLAHAMDLDPGLISALEGLANAAHEGSREGAVGTEPAGGSAAWLADADLRSALTEANPTRRISSLPRQELLFIW